MKPFCTTIGAAVVLTLLACSDGTTNPAAEPARMTLHELVLSNAVSASSAVGPSARVASASAGMVAYVSLPPGTLPDMVRVRIRNATTDLTTPAIAVIDGGFDPVPVAGGAGDALELTFAEANGSERVVHAIIPPERPPAVVRTNPPRGRTAVALSVRPLLIFSEPIDPGTLASGVRLRGSTGAEVVASVSLRVDQPWVAELVPEVTLEPGATYELQATRDIRDLDGDALAEPVTAAFTTVSHPPSASPPSSASIAFVSNRDGSAHLYLANADGSGVTRVTEGSSPAWSRDGRRIAFVRQASSAGPAGIYVLNVPGFTLRYVGPGSFPTWSPDGRIAFSNDDGIAVMHADGSAARQLISNSWLCGSSTGCRYEYQAVFPAWSPDGRIAFVAGPDIVGIVEPDGSDTRDFQRLDDLGPFIAGSAAWSPDGSRIAVVSIPSPIPWYQPTYPWTIHTYDMDSARLQSVHTAPGRGFGGAPNYPEWSPDGDRILFAAQSREGDSYGAHRRIFTLSLKTGEVRQLIPDAVDPVAAEYRDWGAVWYRGNR